MRVRWLVSVAAGVAVLAGAGAIVAVTVYDSARPVHHNRPPVITVTHLGARAVDGVIAAGTIDGKPWRVKLIRNSTSHAPCSSPPGGPWAPNSNCTETVGALINRWQAFPGPANILSDHPALFGPVQSGVERVSLRLSDGVVLILHPVQAFGHRWIGFVLPPRLTPAKVTVYSRAAELAHSVPFHDTNSREDFFLSWLPAGDEGPSRMTKVIRGGGRTLILRTGPWGNILVGDYEGWAFSLDDHPNGALEGSGELPRTVAMAFPWPARYMTLAMSNGSTRRIRLVQGAGLAFALVLAPRQPSIDEWNVYDGRGHRLSGGHGAPGGI